MSLFFELIRVALMQRNSLSTIPTPQEWEEMYQLSHKHALTGIAYCGLERLPKNQLPDLSLSWQWNEDTREIEAKNLIHRKRAIQLLKNLQRDGFKAVIFKGTSLSPYYPKHLSNRRSPGDIDTWVVSAIKGNQTVPVSLREIIEYAQKTLPNHFLCYLHYDFDVFSDVPVELHLRPTFSCVPWYNHRLQQWYHEVAHKVGYADEALDANTHCIILLLHIYKHLFENGIGLRQLLDLYIAIDYNKTHNGKALDTHLLSYLGISQFYQDISYVLRIVFEENTEKTTSDKRGQFLLEEICQAGNFGQYDERIKQRNSKSGYAYEKLKHNLRLLHYYPSQVLWEPIFRLYHSTWRIFKLWRLE